MHSRFYLNIILLALLSTCITCVEGAQKHVVVMVWDGMRPDFITPSNTPNLYQLSQRGVWFANHHPVYPSLTEANGTAIATGTYPAVSGLMANKEYRPLIESLESIHTEEFKYVQKGDAISHGHYLKSPTTAETLRKHGKSTQVAGAKPVAVLHDRSPRPADARYVTLFAGQTLPKEAITSITNLHGIFPEITRNDWTTDSLINPLWTNGVSDFSLLWMNEPDASQHSTGPGSVKSLSAIHETDKNLGKIIRCLADMSLLESTDVLVVSDHGFSTISAIVDAGESLRAAGFKANDKFDHQPTGDEIMIASNGGTILLYTGDHKPELIQKLVKFFQHWQHTGVIMTRREMPGTFAMSTLHIDSGDAPDLAVSLHWSDTLSENGTPGLLVCNQSSYKPGQGMHGSLSRFDMHNTFIAAGPDFKSGIIDQLPTGNVDIAPTVLHLLGVTPPDSMKGRIVSEALVNGGPKLKHYSPTHLVSTSKLTDGTWEQYLDISEVNGTVYIDKGNGELTK